MAMSFHVSRCQYSIGFCSVALVLYGAPHYGEMPLADFWLELQTEVRGTSSGP